MKRIPWKKIFIGLLAILIILQFFPIDKSQPAVDNSKDFITITQPPAEIATLLKEACYDCHSYEVKFPWYTNVAPISYWIKGHIDNGVKKLNYSIWADYNSKKAHHKLDESVEMMENQWMPIYTYKWMHSEGRLTDEEYTKLKDFFSSEMEKIKF